MEDIFGLPAHPLMVHGAVVLLPLAAVATLACAAVPRLRRPYAPLALGLALAATAAVVLAQLSGEELEERVEETELVEEHTGEGERVLPWAIAVTVAAAAVTAVPAVERRRPATPSRSLTAAVVVVALVAGAGAIWATVDVGHSGAKATWDDVDEDGDGKAGGDGEDGDGDGEDEDEDEDGEDDVGGGESRGGEEALGASDVALRA